jgi:branched-chain amino acid transport system substrate-binding protein
MARFRYIAGASCAAIALAALLTPVPAHTQSQEPIKIGAVLSTSGAAAGLGIPERSGALAAEKEINEKGGVNGRPIKLVIEDDTTNPDTAVSKVNDLIYNQKVVAVIGGSNLPSSVAIGGITDKVKIPQFAFTGLGPAAEKARPCEFHMYAAHDLNARALLGYAVEFLKAKTIGVLYDSGYGAVVMREFDKVVDQYPVKIVAREKFELSATDVTAEAAKIKAANPDVIFVITVQAAPFRAVRNLQMKQTIVAVNGSSSYETVNAMGSAADNIIFPEFVVTEDPLPNQKEFVAYLQTNFKIKAKNAEAVAWDAVHAIAAALKKTGPDASHEELCQAIKGPYSGVTTQYDFSAPDLTGIKLSGYLFSRLVNGQYTRLPDRLND